MDKEKYIKKIEESNKLSKEAKKFFINQIDNYYIAKDSGYVSNNINTI